MQRTHKVSAGLAWLGGPTIGYELAQVTQEAARSSADLIAQASAILATISAHDLRPVLVLDDTDKWLSRSDPEVALERRQGFFGSVVRLIGEEFAAAAVVAVHPSYLADRAYQEARGFLSTTDAVPALPSAAAVREILAHRARLALTTSGQTAPEAAESLVDNDALDLLFEHYQAGAHSDLRSRVLLVVHTAVAMAVDDDKATVSRAVMRAAITETGDD